MSSGPEHSGMNGAQKFGAGVFVAAIATAVVVLLLPENRQGTIDPLQTLYIPSVLIALLALTGFGAMIISIAGGAGVLFIAAFLGVIVAFQPDPLNQQAALKEKLRADTPNWQPLTVELASDDAITIFVEGSIMPDGRTQTGVQGYAKDRPNSYLKVDTIPKVGAALGRLCAKNPPSMLSPYWPICTAPISAHPKDGLTLIAPATVGVTMGLTFVSRPETVWLPELVVNNYIKDGPWDNYGSYYNDSRGQFYDVKWAAPVKARFLSPERVAQAKGL